MGHIRTLRQPPKVPDAPPRNPHPDRAKGEDDYTDDFGMWVCEVIALADVGLWRLQEWYGKSHGFPAPTTLLRWLDKHRDFRQQYARAKRIQADRFAYESTEIVDDVPETKEAIWKAREQAAHRRWLAKHLDAKVYGDRMVHAGDADAPVSFADLAKKAEEEPEEEGQE